MDLARQLFDAGVIGAGGAGFPTYKKLADGVSLLVVNAAECEPLLASDRFLMRHRADEIVAGALAVAGECGIPRIVVGTKAHYTRELAALRAAIEAAGADIEIHTLDSFYPAGDEQVLVYEITGQTVPPGGLPLDIGAVVMNAATAANVAAAVRGEPVTRRLVTVTGEVAHPVVVDAPVGATAADLIAAAGGVTASPYVIVKGGPMMGKHHPMSEVDRLGFGKADGGLVVLPADHSLVSFMSQPVERLLNETKSICIQCRACTEMCPRYLIGHQMRPHMVMRALQSGVGGDALTDALLCCECGVCELYACPMGLSPRKMNVYVKGLLRAQGVTIADRQVHPEHAAERELRRISQERFIDHLRLDTYPTTVDDQVRLEPDHVWLATRHGVGKPASPCVAVGEQVAVGQLVAAAEFGDVAAPVHASIAGTVTEADASHITITAVDGPLARAIDRGAPRTDQIGGRP